MKHLKLFEGFSGDLDTKVNELIISEVKAHLEPCLQTLIDEYDFVFKGFDYAKVEYVSPTLALGKNDALKFVNELIRTNRRLKSIGVYLSISLNHGNETVPSILFYSLLKRYGLLDAEVVIFINDGFAGKSHYDLIDENI